MSNRQQTLVEMYHPTFREGYQAGRQQQFQEQVVLTDMHLVEYLQSIFQEEEAAQGSESVYYTIGRLVGQMSGVVIPRQPDEENTQALQEAFLVKVRQAYGATGQALIDTIRQFWTLLDQLAQTLEADLFEQMMKRGVEQKGL